MNKIINYNFDKKKAIALCKKAISGKFAIAKDGGDVLKVGAPMMTATIIIKDNTIEVSGKGPGATVANTCASEIEMAVEEYQESHSTNPAPETSAPVPNQAPQGKGTITVDEYFEYSNKIIALLKQYKDLVDSGILTEEEFQTKKEDLLNFINGMMH